ncbi:MAG: fibronectin type III domain-containing protein [Kiritimatiellae bacterium]|nr:fibronectin type III domain-containing protein [Kiritimatiellia bacterium]
MSRISAWRRIRSLPVCVLWLMGAAAVHAATVTRPTFSKAHGFYSSSFTVVISSSTAGATIRYTTDGSQPSASSGTVLANGGSVTVSTTTCLRACAYAAGMTTSPVFTQTYIFLAKVITQTRPSNYPSMWGANTGDYDMDPNIVNDSRYKSTIQNDLKSIPTLSLVAKIADLFSDNGIYWTGGMHGGENVKEVPGSLELIYPDGRPGFQIDCGLKSHTGIDRKRTIRLLFKSNYGGPVKLEYPFFEDAPVNASSAIRSFGKLLLRTGNNEMWCAGWTTYGSKLEKVTYLRDEWLRGSFIKMTGLGNHGTFMHLYINGMYWGVYNPIERPDARFAADYIGGSKADWYARNMAGPISGSATRYNYLISTLVKNGGFANASTYNTVKQYLDVERYCDYVLLNWFAHTCDWGKNNWYGVNRNSPAGPFQFMTWDADVSWRAEDGSTAGAWVSPSFYTSTHSHYNADMCKLWRACDDNKDFLCTVADRAYKHCFNGGALTEANSKSRWDALAAYVERAIVGESARWGDCFVSSGHPRYTLDNHWKPARTDVRNTMTGNPARLISALRANSPALYPSIDPPTYHQYGGTVAAGFKLTISRANGGTVYYRTDGQDPRVSGGGILAGSDLNTAASFTVTLTSTCTVKARLKNGATWSALADAKFTVTGSVVTPPAAPGSLTAASLSASQIKVNWSDNSNNETGFKLERSLNGSTWSQITQPAANATTYTDSGLAAATKYYYRVRAYNSAGDSGYSNVGSATTGETVPSAPGSLTAASLSASQIKVSWIDSSSNETGFKIDRRKSGTTTWERIATPGANATSYTDSGLAAATLYYYIVKATNAAGDSPYSNTAAATTGESVPAAPSGVAAVAQSATSIRVTWTDNSSNETGFKIDRRQSGTQTWVRIATPGANATSYTDSGLAAATQFYYKVIASNAAGDSPESNVAAATTDESLPAQPANLAASVLSATEIRVTWTDTSDNETGFKIRRSLDGVDWDTPPPVYPVANATSYTDSGLSGGTTYYYMIRSENAAGVSAYTAPVTATTGVATPAAPSGLTATAASSTSVALAWTDNASNETQYKIDRRQSGTDAWVRVAEPGADTTQYTDSGLSPNTEYYYMVKASNAAGNSPYSNVAAATTDEGLPAQPANLAASALSATEIRVTWTDTSDNETGFKIRRSLDGVDWDTPAPVYPAANATSYTDSGLAGGTTYYYKIRSENAAGVSAYTAPVTATTGVATPAAPSGLTATAASPTSVDLAWTDNASNETQYKIDRRESGTDIWARVAEPAANTTRYTDWGLAPNTHYYFMVKASNAAGDSPYSSAAEVTTPVALDTFTAYNDLAWASGQLAQNITTYTRGEAGLLVDHASGQALGVRLTLNNGGYGPVLTQGADPAAGTEADAVFGGIVDCVGVISHSAENLTLTLTGLDPAKRYELVLFGNRDNPAYTERLTTITLSGAAGFSNRSSDGTDYHGTSDAAVTLCNGYNTASGYVARYVSIDPGSDGELLVTVADGTSGCYVNALMLRCGGDGSQQQEVDKIGEGGTWKYRKGTAEASAPPAAWREPAFDDGGWASGATPMGYSGSLSVATELADMRGSYSCVFLRKSFTAAKPWLVSALNLSANYDDGFVMWINGREVARVNVAGTAGSAVSHAGFAAGTVEPTAWTATLAGSALPALHYTNVVAVQVFNSTLSSSDLVIDVGLSVIEGSPLDTGRDSDGDGMDDAWEQATLGGAAPTGEADADGDGISNLEEYIAGTDPGQNGSCFAVDVGLVGGQVDVSFETVPASGTGYTDLTRHYALEACPKADEGNWLVVPGYEDILGAGQTVTYQPAGDPSAGVYRGRVWLE